MKGAWVMHTLRSAINDDVIWFEILKEFMTENAKSHVSTEDFFVKVREKTGTDFSYFSEQYFYTPNQPKLEYYQTDSNFYYKWSNVNDNFIMPIDLLVNGNEQRVLPNQEFQSFDIREHASIEIMDWKFYVLPVKKDFK
jgi:aminopeptidase N